MNLMKIQIKTPLYDLTKFRNVYEPREDTFLLLDAIENDLCNIIKIKPIFIVEVGSGSGIIITALSSILKNPCFATDINSEACLATLKTSEINKTAIDICHMDFLNFFKRNVFDIIIFNPPYVVTASEEICGQGLARSWAGGLNGREIIDKFLKSLPNTLSVKGICYLLILKENIPEEVINIAKEMSFDAKIIMERKVRCEHLFVLKLHKS